jgi:hypothetical protein
MVQPIVLQAAYGLACCVIMLRSSEQAERGKRRSATGSPLIFSWTLAAAYSSGSKSGYPQGRRFRRGLFIFVALLTRFDVLLVRAAMGMFATLFAGFSSAFRIVFEIAATMLAAFALAGMARRFGFFSHCWNSFRYPFCWETHSRPPAFHFGPMASVSKRMPSSQSSGSMTGNPEGARLYSQARAPEKSSVISEG